MSKVKPYSVYKDFDQEWLGDLPAHWTVMRTKLLFDLVTEPAPVGNSEELLSVYTALGVKPRKELEARGNKASSTDNYWRVEQGDIIVNKLLAWMGAIGISEYKGVTSPAYDILRHKEYVNPYFYNYLFRNPISSKEFKRHSRGIMDMRLRLYFTRFGDIKLPYPPIEEQNKIVEYLQFKLKRIDRFIRKKKQLIKLLREQKAVIINQAVTRGLDPNAKMKPSGIEWLGDIPEHWITSKLKFITDKIVDGAHFTPTYVDEGIPFLRVTDLKNEVIDLEEVKYIPIEEHQELIKRCNPQKGDVLLSKNGTIGITKSINWDWEFSIFVSLCLIKLKPSLDADFFSTLFGSKAVEVQLTESGQTTSVTNLHLEKIKELICILPPVSEQKSIVSYLTKEMAYFNHTISIITKEITLTQEYKTALIAEAVTGKIDVRDFVVPEVVEEETYEELEEELNMVAEDDNEYQNEDLDK